LRTHVPGSRLAVIPNPVHWPLPRTEPVLVPPADGRPRLLAVGRLHPDKGFDVLIDAYARIAPRYPDWDLVILGEGEECAALQRRVDEAGLAQRVALP
ncbi:glycosyltransferase, partial [Bordetella pertussis]